MAYIPIPDEHRAAMLEAVGVSTVEDLFADIPACSLMSTPLALPAGMTEMEIRSRLFRLAARDTSTSQLVSFLGAGCYDSFVPAIVDATVSRPEFFTAYTPYQPEISQGTLQAIYEYQSYVTRLTGMDVANASMYDGATAMVEAALLAVHQTGRRKVVVSGAVHPEWIETLRTYAEAGLMEPVVAYLGNGTTEVDALGPMLVDAACLVVSDPNFFGNLEDLDACAAKAHEAGALFVVATDLSLLGVLDAPGAHGADVVVGEGQPLGNSQSYGGPGFGFFAARDKFLRRMPGRIVGRTVDADGAPAFVLTMQTREQHIRREKATSNICSNHALNALAALVHLAMLGPQGLYEVGASAVAKAHYLRDGLVASGKFTAPWAGPLYAREFVVRYEGDLAAMQAEMLERGYLAGVALARFPTAAEVLDTDTDQLVLFAVTEKRTRGEIDAFVEEVASL